MASSWVLMRWDDSHARQVELLGSGDSLSKSQEREFKGPIPARFKPSLAPCSNTWGPCPGCPDDASSPFTGILENKATLFHIQKTGLLAPSP